MKPASKQDGKKPAAAAAATAKAAPKAKGKKDELSIDELAKVSGGRARRTSRA